MRAVIMDSSGSVRIANRPDPTSPGPQGVIIAVEATGICGSDLHFYDGDLPCIDGLSVGHEAVGVVVDAGEQVHRVAEGDRVVVSCITGCGHCHGCAVGDRPPAIPALRCSASAVHWPGPRPNCWPSRWPIRRYYRSPRPSPTRPRSCWPTTSPPRGPRHAAAR